MVKWLRRQRIRWFGHFPSAGADLRWFDEDGRAYTTEQHIGRITSMGGEGVWLGSRFHLQTRIPGGIRVSTVFLGLDHGFMQPVAVLWETCVFTPNGSDVVDRYTCKWDAVRGHWRHTLLIAFYRLRAALQREPRLKPLPREESDD